MAQKNIWLTWLPGQKSEQKPGEILLTLQKYGYETQGNNWIDDLDKMPWANLVEVLKDKTAVDAWIVAGNREDFASRTTLYGLAMVNLAAFEHREGSLPVILLGLDFTPEVDNLPTPMRSNILLSATTSAWTAKLVAAMSKFKKPEKEKMPEFRLITHAMASLGQWFEVGPRQDEWQGVLFGVTEEGTITHHGVGPKGKVPAKTILQYAVEGMKAEVGGKEFTIWSVQNRLGPDDSYYIKVDKYPSYIVCAGHAGEEHGEASIIRLSGV